MTLLLNNLEIDGFRGINKLRMEGLGRVNLLVGKNNSGKTRVLDAIRVFSESASPLVFTQISKEHDEHYDTNEEWLRTNNANFLRYFFNYRTLPTKDDIKIISIGDGEGFEVTVHHQPIIEERFEEDGRIRIKRRLIKDTTDADIDSNPTYDAIVSTIIKNKEIISRLIIADTDVENNELSMRGEGFVIRRKRQDHNYKYIPSSFVDYEELATLWDMIVLSDKEAIIIDMMKIIDSKIDDLAFIGEKSRRDRHPIIRLIGDTPAPLGSLGDGAYRVFQLALNLVNAQHGFLLIDEFENGLHYKTQTAIWSFIFDFASKLDIQVFATTHSSDCIAAFAEAATNHPELGCAYHLGQSIIDGKTIATRYDEARLKELVDMGRDIR